MKVIVKGKGPESLTQRNFIASGGEGSIYVKGNIAYKIYIKPSHMIPEAKIAELSSLTSPEIIKPEHVLLDERSTPIGYTMKYIERTTALCQVFTKAFKNRNNLRTKELLSLIQQFRNNVQHCHDNNILIVDLNEMNFLLDGSNFNKIYFIDVDSYQTRSYPATAIMDSIRDRHCKNKFNANTDWFSFGILTFQMLTGIHPYKGKHPTFKNLEQRMDNNISVFNTDVSLPPIVDNFNNTIPETYRTWYKSIFEDGVRFPFPPSLDAVIITKPMRVRVITGTDNFDIKEVGEYDFDIINFQSWGGHEIILTSDGLIIDKRLDKKVASYSHIGISPIYGHVVSAIIKNNRLQLYNVTAGQDIPFDFIGVSLFSYNNRLYIVHGENISEIMFTETKGRLFVYIRPVCNILLNATQIFDGVAIQNLLGLYYISIFPESGVHQQIKIKELEGFRIVNAKYHNNILIVIGEHGGIYNRFIFKFNDKYEYSIIETKDVSYTEINFTVLDNGICIYVNEDGFTELFFNRKDNNTVKLIQDTTLSGTKLFNKGNQTYFAKDNKLFSIRMK